MYNVYDAEYRPPPLKADHELSETSTSLPKTRLESAVVIAPPFKIQRELKEAASQDRALQALSSTIRLGWPASKSSLPEIVHPYFDVRDELTVQDELVFKGTQLVIPYALRKRMMEMVHDTHIGIDGCIRRARECMYWP